MGALMCNDTSISENPGLDNILKNTGYTNHFKAENYGRKISNHVEFNHSDLNYTDSIPAKSTNIEPENQYDSSNYILLQKLMSWN